MRLLTLPLAVCLLLLVSACQKIETDSPVSPPNLNISAAIAPLDGRPPLEKSSINRYVHHHLRQDQIFRWDMVDAYVVWSAAMQTDSIISLGYRAEGFQDISKFIHEIDVNDPEWQVVRESLIDFVVKGEQKLHPDQEIKAEDILAFGEKPLPYLNIKITNYETIAKLRQFEVVRYVEPMGYGTERVDIARSEKGCGGGPDYSIPSSDYVNISPGSKLSWNLALMNVQNAWSVSTGDNITVGLIDTGISPDQNKLNSKFATGLSTNRFRDKTGFFKTGWWWWESIDGPDDDCGHGTNMAGVIAAPLTSSGATVGVAYEANLVSVRGTDDVVINESNEKEGVSDALVYLGDRKDVKIISMSLGDVFHSGQVADAVRYAYNKGKLIFAAAGTSFSWTSWWGVIFPANMSETVAVTGIKTGSPMKRCSNCHDGSAVDFVVVMEDRNNSDRTPLTLHTSGNTPRRTGGSSVATATLAGTAALVWGANPSQSRSQVLQRLKDGASIYPSRSGSFGWGTVDALQAVSAVQ